ncbi:MAG: sulfatase-like hydrolase/transferase [Actinomycetota bacterium]
MPRPHVLLITLDQFRGDALSVAGHPVVRTPHIDRLARDGVRFARHYTQSTPCGPGRAGLYTGMYQMNHRVVANGTPLDHRFDNVALVARRAGYAPALFGYTDQSIDPRVTSGPEDPRLSSYEGLLPGFDWVLDMSGPHQPWVDHLAAHGHDVSRGHLHLLATEHERPTDMSVSTFMTDRVIDWIERRPTDEPWFVHASYLRPHPPYSASGEYATMYDPATVGTPITPAHDRHPFHDLLLGLDGVRAPADADDMARLRAQYFGMITAVDAEMGRLWDALERLGLWENTVIVLTTDHGEQLGDHGLLQKLAWFEESHHVPLVVRDPRRPVTHGTTIERFTESVDVLPTLADLWGLEVPRQCDGLPLTPFLDGDEPPVWRDGASWEFDWRYALIPLDANPWPWDRRLEECNLAVHRTLDTAYVQFGDGTHLCFDIATDPTWRTLVDDPARVLAMAQRMLTWRSRHADRTHTGLLVQAGGVGVWPPGVPWKDDER